MGFGGIVCGTRIFRTFRRHGFAGRRVWGGNGGLFAVENAGAGNGEYVHYGHVGVQFPDAAHNSGFYPLALAHCLGTGRGVGAVAGGHGVVCG